MAPRFSFVCKAMFAFFLSMYSVNTLSEERLDKAEQCVSIKSNIVPKLVGDIFTLAKVDGRDAWAENNLELALLSNDGNASIYVACKDNITRFQIALDKPVKHNLLNVHIANNDTNHTASKIDWQSAERGYLLDAGRGLYAIQQLKSILYIDTFSVSLPQEDRQFIFKNNGLASQVAPIRKECGW